MPEVSVVIPTYERPPYLPGAIETALGQTHDDVEVVVVDGGSGTDYAQETTAGYDRVRCVVRDDVGVAAARNAGVEATTGEYVAFLDDDDRWHETKLARQVECLERRPEAGVATCLMVSVTPDGEVITCQGDAPEGDVADRILVEDAVGSPSRLLVRRECLPPEPFDAGGAVREDWDLSIRLCREWEVALVADHLYVRTEHRSRSSDPAAAERALRGVIEKYEDRIRERGLYDRTMANFHESVGRTALGTDERAMAREHLGKAVRTAPSKRRIALLALAFLPPAALSAALSVKRGVETRRNDCPTAADLAREVPGFPPAG